MEKVFETENVILFENEGKIIGNVSKEEAVKALEEAGVEALQKLDFETTISAAAIAAKVIENYEQGDVLEEENVDILLDIIEEAYEADTLDELFTLTAFAHKLTGKSVLELIDQVHEQMLKDKKG
jgi:hypothetical protein